MPTFINVTPLHGMGRCMTINADHITSLLPLDGVNVMIHARTHDKGPIWEQRDNCTQIKLIGQAEFTALESVETIRLRAREA